MSRVRELVARADAIALDVVGTIVETREPFAETYARVARQFGFELTGEIVAARFHAVMREIWGVGDTLTDEDRERERWAEVVRRVMPETVNRFEPIFDELWVYFSSAQAWAWYDDARRLIEMLIGQSRCWGLASNFDGRLHLWAKTQPVLHRASFIRTSADVGLLKRDPGFYSRLLSTAKWRAGEAGNKSEFLAVMIGDQPDNDYVPAEQAAWQPISLCRDDASHQKALDEGRLAIRSLDELF